jgi:hypothetical protein
MVTDEEFWRLDPIAKAQTVIQEINRVATRARAAGLPATSYILRLSAQEAEKELASTTAGHP